jgi:hypothetical protein
MNRLLFITGILFLSSSSVLPCTDGLARQGCSCQLTKNFTASSFDYDITFMSGPADQNERTLFTELIEEAAGRWQYQFVQRGDNIHLHKVSSGGNVHIIITDQIIEGQANYSNGTMTLPLEWIKDQQKYSSSYVRAVVQHEFGHPLGYAQMTAQGCDQASIMSDTFYNNYRSNFTSCDFETLTRDYGSIRTDNDSDGWALEDDPADCRDDRPDMYPGAPNPQCGYMLDPGEDYNCNGIEDQYEPYEDVCPDSPIIIDVTGNGLSLTDRAHGVMFDLSARGLPRLLPWTDIGVDDAWLALDRNGNGTIDNGGELFGNFTPQPRALEPNGFLALAVFDQLATGGNADGWIDGRDVVFGQLFLWTDENHNGLSETGELTRLPRSVLKGISLEYADANRVDQYGNWFRYRAKVLDHKNRDVGPWAFDVYLGGRPKRLVGRK